MISFNCDVCNKPIEESDLHIVEIHNKVTDKPSMKPLDVCVWCKEDLIKYLSSLSRIPA